MLTVPAWDGASGGDLRLVVSGKLVILMEKDSEVAPGGVDVTVEVCRVNHFWE